MECDKFESAMMDELYGELDELTSAAAKRHVAGCTRCAALLDGLRATRRVAAVRLVDPPRDLERRILDAAAVAMDQASPGAPDRAPRGRSSARVGRRLASAVSIAGKWAMRPQTAMAALFLVSIGTGVLLLRGKSSRAPATAQMHVIEQGTPAPAAASGALDDPGASGVEVAANGTPPAHAPAEARQDSTRAHPAAPAPKPAGRAVSPGDELAFRDQGFARPPAPERASAAPLARKASNVALGGTGAGGGAPMAAAAPAAPTTSPKQASAAADQAQESAAPAEPAATAPDLALRAARSVRDSQGCAAAVARFDEAAQRAAGTPQGWDALFEGAVCYRAIGNFEAARARLQALQGIAAYRSRAQAELDRLNRAEQGKTQP